MCVCVFMYMFMCVFDVSQALAECLDIDQKDNSSTSAPERIFTEKAFHFHSGDCT